MKVSNNRGGESEICLRSKITGSHEKRCARQQNIMKFVYNFSSTFKICSKHKPTGTVSPPGTSKCMVQHCQIASAKYSRSHQTVAKAKQGLQVLIQSQRLGNDTPIMVHFYTWHSWGIGDEHFMYWNAGSGMILLALISQWPDWIQQSEQSHKKQNAFVSCAATDRATLWWMSPVLHEHPLCYITARNDTEPGLVLWADAFFVLSNEGAPVHLCKGIMLCRHSENICKGCQLHTHFSTEHVHQGPFGPTPCWQVLTRLFPSTWQSAAWPCFVFCAHASPKSGQDGPWAQTAGLAEQWGLLLNTGASHFQSVQRIFSQNSMCTASCGSPAIPFLKAFHAVSWSRDHSG